MLDGKTVLLTGTNGGIGISITETLLKNRAKLLLFYNNDRLKIDDTLLLKILINLPLPKYVYCIMDSPDDIYSRFITREKKIGNDVNGYTVTDFKNANIFLSLLIEKLKSIGVNVVVLNKESFVL